MAPGEYGGLPGCQAPCDPGCPAFMPAGPVDPGFVPGEPMAPGFMPAGPERPGFPGSCPEPAGALVSCSLHEQDASAPPPCPGEFTAAPPLIIGAPGWGWLCAAGFCPPWAPAMPMPPAWLSVGGPFIWPPACGCIPVFPSILTSSPFWGFCPFIGFL